MLSNGKYGNSQYFVFLNNEIFKTFFSLHLYNMINSCCKRYAITGETWLCSEARGEKIVKKYGYVGIRPWGMKETYEHGVKFDRLLIKPVR